MNLNQGLERIKETPLRRYVVRALKMPEIRDALSLPVGSSTGDLNMHKAKIALILSPIILEKFPELSSEGELTKKEIDFITNFIGGIIESDLRTKMQ